MVVVILLTSLVDGCRKESVSSREEVEEGTRMWGSAPSRPAPVPPLQYRPILKTYLIIAAVSLLSTVSAMGRKSQTRDDSRQKKRRPAPESVTYAMPESTNKLYFFFHGKLKLAFKNTRYFPIKQPSTPLSKKRNGSHSRSVGHVKTASQP
jgi:hypothetical protein